MFLLDEELKKLQVKKLSMERELEETRLIYQEMLNSVIERRKRAYSLEVINYKIASLWFIIEDFNNIIINLKLLNNFYSEFNKEKHLKKISDEIVYKQFKNYYREIRDIVIKLGNERYSTIVINKYLFKILQIKDEIKNIDFFYLDFGSCYTLDSNNINEVKSYFSIRGIIEQAIINDWDYQYFMKMISLFNDMKRLEYNALAYHIDYEDEELQNLNYLKENPAHVIEHNPKVLESDLYDSETLSEAKKVLMKNERKKAVKNINKVLKKDRC